MKKWILPVVMVFLLSAMIIVPYAMGQSVALPEPGQSSYESVQALPNQTQLLYEPEQALSEPRQPLLIVYVYDPCGGCGAGVQGCGECLEMARINVMVINQLGSLFRDGYVEYRIHNSRSRYFEENRLARAERYDIPDDLQNIWPTVFIGTEDSGLYLLGEDLMPYIREMFDRYMSGEDAEALQREIAKRGGW